MQSLANAAGRTRDETNFATVGIDLSFRRD
jgi:hypothetical protein